MEECGWIAYSVELGQCSRVYCVFVLAGAEAAFCYVQG